MPPRYTPKAPLPKRYFAGKGPAVEEHYSTSEEEDDEEDEEQKITNEDAGPADHEGDNVDSALRKELPVRSGAVISAVKIRPVDLGRRAERTVEEEENIGEHKDTNEEEDEDEDDESSDDYDSEASELQKPPILRATFVPKSSKTDNSLGSPLEKNGEALANEDERESESRKRKAEALFQVEAQLCQDRLVEVADQRQNKVSVVDDTDGLDEVAEKVAWKLRELLRIKRDRDALIAQDLEKEEIERRRNMDEEKRLKEDLERVAKQKAEKEKFQLTQGKPDKPYHKRVFYQDLK